MNKTIALVGRTNVGKSSIFNKLVKAKSSIVSSQEGLTRDMKTAELKSGKKTVQLVDTGGFFTYKDDDEAKGKPDFLIKNFHKDSIQRQKFYSVDGKEYARKIIQQVEKIQTSLQKSIGTRFCWLADEWYLICLLYTSPSPRDVEESRMPSSA